MTTAIRCRAVVGAEAAGEGRGTRISTLRSDPPLTLRMAGGALYRAASAAGPVGCDDVALDVSVGPGAALEVRSVAATLVLPGPSGAASSTTVTARVGSGAVLRWLPEPTVLVRQCDHRVAGQVNLAATATMVWRDELVLGRYGELSGSVLQRLDVERAGRPLLRTEQALGPRWPGSDGPAGMAGHRAVGMVLVVGPQAPALALPVGEDGADGPVRIAVSHVADDAVIVAAVARTARALRLALDRSLPR